MDQVYASCIKEYMKGVNRDARKYKTQEVFTPDWMVDIILGELPDYLDFDAVCLDRAVGDGQFSSKVLIGKMLHYQKQGTEIHDSFIMALDSIFGVDIEPDNVTLCRERLLCGCTDPDIVDLVCRRIVIGDCLNPNDKISGQTDRDHQLMKKYFTSGLILD